MDRQHVEPAGDKAPGLVVPHIGPEGQLAVGGGGQKAPAGAQRAVEQERPDGLLTLEPLEPRRHREARVLGKHRHDGVDVRRLPRVRPALHERRDRVVAQLAQHRLLGLGGCVHGLAGALQRAVDRRGRGVEQFGHLRGGEAEDLTEDQGRSLHRGEVLERRDVGELDRLAGHDPVLGCGVRVGLEPADLRGRHVGRHVNGKLAPAAPLQRSEAAVGGDLEQPGADEAAVVEPVHAAPGPDQRLLHRVFGIVQRAEHAVAVSLDLRAVRCDERLERVGIPGARRLEQNRGHGPIIAIAMSFRATRGFTSDTPQPQEAS